jgi:putative oxidoreductase
MNCPMRGFLETLQSKTACLQDLALLLARLAMGFAFILHGWGKLQNWLHWGDSLGIPSVFQALAAVGEFGGGVALVLGLLTPLASLTLLITMSVAILLAHVPAGHPFVGKPGEPSFELPAIYWVLSLLLLTFGSGRFSVEGFMGCNKK